MKKLLAIMVLGLLWSNQGNTAEKIYCVDLDAKSYNNFPIYVLADKDKSGACSKGNLSGTYKGRKLITLSKKDYLTYHNLKYSYPRISGDKLKSYLEKNNLNSAIRYVENKKSKSFKKTVQARTSSCGDKIDYSWSVSGNYAAFKFESNSEKSIYITNVTIYTSDSKVVLKEETALNLKPFGAGSTNVYIGDRNKNAIKKANYRCSFNSSNLKKIKNNNDDGGMKWWYWVLIVIGFIFLGALVEENFKKAKKNKVTSINKVQVSNQNFWDGSQSLAVTFWGYFIGGNAVINVLTLILTSSSFVIIIILALVIWNVAAIIGVFKSANIYKAEKIKQGKDYIWANAAKIGSVLLILSAIGNAL